MEATLPGEGLPGEESVTGGGEPHWNDEAC